MNCASISPTRPRTSCGATPVTLRIRGCGNIGGFKNSKNIIRNRRTKKLMVVSDTGLKKRMDRIIQSFVSQLRCASATGAGATPTGVRPRFSTRSLPHDDCWTAIPELVVTCELVAPGEEGADITIEQLYGRREIPKKPAGKKLPGDREGDRGAPLPAGVRAEEQGVAEIPRKADVPVSG